jgi:hypothetical protein
MGVGGSILDVLIFTPIILPILSVMTYFNNSFKNNLLKIKVISFILSIITGLKMIYSCEKSDEGGGCHKECTEKQCNLDKKINSYLVHICGFSLSIFICISIIRFFL